MVRMKSLNSPFRLTTQLICCTLVFMQLSLFCPELEAQIFSKVRSSDINTPRGSTFGCGWIDFNNDGYLDLICNNYDQPDNLFINNKDGSFTLSNDLSLYGVYSYFSGITWGDYDNDGFNDLFLTTLSGSNVLLHNLGNGSYQRVANSPVNTASDIHLHCTWVDYNNDGWLDLFVPTVSSFNFAKGGGSAGHLFLNNGNGTFKRIIDNEITEPGNHQCASFADIDNDGDMDLFLTEWELDNVLFENNGDGTFTKISGSEVNTNTNVSMTCSWGDYDNDGFMDLFVGNGSLGTTKQNNLLYHNNGDKTFTRIITGDAVNTPGDTWTSAWGDIDNDGDLDLITGDLIDPNAAYLNDCLGNFTKTNVFDTVSSGTSGLALGDYDNDGFLDLFVAQAGNLGNTLYHNTGNANHWIMVTCRGTVSNRSAIGARVQIKATISGHPTWQTREINGNQGFRSSGELRAHFGLGDATVIDTLIIHWPSSIITVQTNIAPNQFLTVTEEIPAQFLKAVFSADTIEGRDSLTVHFHDLSAAGSSNPVTSWGWDLNGDGIDESHEQNPVYIYRGTEGKTYSIRLTISDGQRSLSFTLKDYIQMFARNYSIGKRTSASSTRNATFTPDKAFDGNLSTRWYSATNQTEWIMVDLDSAYTINKIVLRWQLEYGKEYQIQTALDTLNWTTVFTHTNGTGGKEEILISPVQAKYVRIYCTKAQSTNGYSLVECEIYNQEITGMTGNPQQPHSFSLEQNYPNPFNPSTNIRYDLPQKSQVTVTVFNILGIEIATLVNGEEASGQHEINFNAENLPSGIYLYRIQAGKYVQTKKMSLMK